MAAFSILILEEAPNVLFCPMVIDRSTSLTALAPSLFISSIETLILML